MFGIYFLLVILALAGAAHRWGADTRDVIDSAEWERRKSWRGRW